MMIEISDIERLNMAKICQYLRKHQWTRLEPLANGDVEQFHFAGTDDVVLVPLSNRFSDYNSVVNRLIESLSVVEQLPINSLLEKLINPSSDILRWRIADKSTALGSITINSIQSNIEIIKNALATTCVDILSPSSFHKKVNIKEVNQQIDKYRFGQTDVGSYVLNLICPLGYYQYEMFEEMVPDGLPLGRKINVQLLKNISDIQKSVEDNSSYIDEVVDSGQISVNFLSALVDLYEENKDSNVCVSSVWNKEVPLIGNEHVDKVILNSKCLDKVGQVVEKYKSHIDVVANQTYYGKIKNINGNPEVINRDELIVSIISIGEDGNKILVKTYLNNNLYSQIVTDAFNSGETVRVEGSPVNGGGTCKLLNATIKVAE